MLLLLYERCYFICLLHVTFCCMKDITSYGRYYFIFIFMLPFLCCRYYFIIMFNVTYGVWHYFPCFIWKMLLHIHNSFLMFFLCYVDLKKANDIKTKASLKEATLKALKMITNVVYEILVGLNIVIPRQSSRVRFLIMMMLLISPREMTITILMLIVSHREMTM